MPQNLIRNTAGRVFLVKDPERYGNTSLYGKGKKETACQHTILLTVEYSKLYATFINTILIFTLALVKAQTEHAAVDVTW